MYFLNSAFTIQGDYGDYIYQALSLLRTYEIPFGPTVTNEENEKTTVRRADAQPIMKVLNQA